MFAYLQQKNFTMHLRRRASQVLEEQLNQKISSKHRHSYLNENIDLKHGFSQFFEESDEPANNKQKINQLNKSVKFLKSKHFIEKTLENDVSVAQSQRTFQKPQKKASLPVQKNIVTYDLSKPKYLIKEIPKKRIVKSLHNFCSVINIDKNLVRDSKKPFKPFNCMKGGKIKNESTNYYDLMNYKRQFKIKLQTNPQNQLKIVRLNKQNDVHFVKKSSSIEANNQKHVQTKKSHKYEVNRLWQIKAIRLKKKQNEMVHKLILNDLIPNVKKIKPISFKITEEDDEEKEQIYRKRRRFNLSHYQQTIKQLNQAEPRYGLMQKAMSITKIKMLQNEGKNIYKLY